ncbi:hypothetical protein [Chryseobacterium contaminans]|uniref:hypothetical protein n=1 Tax=Chryseobacterium contaminans TaxID=1423959 RepID=UPI001E4F26A0|nr:hypothetical protein [Chryseobacterium contaminans]
MDERNPSLVNLYKVPIRKTLNMSSSKKADEMVLMKRVSKLNLLTGLKWKIYPINMGRVPIKAKVNPLIDDWFKESKSRIFFFGNKIFSVRMIGTKVME